MKLFAALFMFLMTEFTAFAIDINGSLLYRSKETENLTTKDMTLQVNGTNQEVTFKMNNLSSKSYTVHSHQHYSKTEFCLLFLDPPLFTEKVADFINILARPVPRIPPRVPRGPIRHPKKYTAEVLRGTYLRGKNQLVFNGEMFRLPYQDVSDLQSWMDADEEAERNSDLSFVGTFDLKADVTSETEEILFDQ